jgi:hypothetical protein
VSGVVANNTKYGVYGGNDALTHGTGAAIRAAPSPSRPRTPTPVPIRRPELASAPWRVAPPTPTSMGCRSGTPPGSSAARPASWPWPVRGMATASTVSATQG